MQGSPELCNKWAVLEIRVPFRGLSIRVPYYTGDLKRDPDLPKGRPRIPKASSGLGQRAAKVGLGFRG